MRENCTAPACIANRTEELHEEKAGSAGAEYELHLSVKQYDKFLESLPDAMVIVSRTGKIMEINSRLVDLFGYAREDLLGKNLEILMPERFRARHRKNVSDFVSSPRRRSMGTGLELFGLKKDGTEFPVDISLGYLTTDGEIVAMAAIRDITEHKNTEHKIELNYQIQRSISSVLKISLEPLSLDEQLNRVLDLIVTLPSFALRTRGSIYLVEHEPERLVLRAMHGFSVSQVATCAAVPLGADRSVSAVPTVCQIMSSDCLDEHHEIQYSTSGDAGQYCVPITYANRALGLINVAVSGGHQRVPEEEEFLSAIASSLAGIIERRQAETEKVRLREQLVESEKLAALGRITANISHTIKNPLTAIGGFANRLMDKLPEGTKEKKYAGLIFSEAIRLENVLQNVLLFSRRDARQREELNLSDTIERALTMYEDICRDKSIKIERHLGVIPPLHANKEQVLQALENLISNAIDAMPQGGTLAVGTDREQAGDQAYLTVKIRDTGQGIPAENIDRIFEPFFTTKLLMKGTGLGLSITKKVVEDHGGFIRVDSEVGAGTTFGLYFPMKRK
jgi:PAS domain S-box-containing protein